MGYVDQNLVSGEMVAYRARLHWIVLLWPVVISALCGALALTLLAGAMASHDKKRETAGMMAVVGLVVLVFAAVFVAAGVLARNAAEFAVTNKRVILKAGVVRKRTVEIFLNKIESVGVDQSLGARVLGYGTIVLRGTGGTLEPFDKIARPLEFRRQVQEQISRASEGRGSAPKN